MDIKRKYGAGVTRRFSVAPMMDWTDRHERFFLRLLSARTLLYTEMVTSMAIIHGDRERLLGYNAQEHPVALQLGGSEPEEVAQAARIGADFGYDEINLNVGCPSDRVQSGRFGACLMKEPELVARIVEAMQKAVAVPVTVKCRLGVDEQEPREVLPAFIETMKGAGISSVTVHARKAWLKGLSPKENRTVPPLDYGLVHEMKEAFPEMEIIINGGIRDLDETEAHLEHVDGVMMGRAAYETPYVLAGADNRLFGETKPIPSRGDVVRAFLPYAQTQQSKGVPLHAMTRHILGLFQGVPGARAWRRHLSENAVKPGAGIDVIEQALGFVDDPAPAMTEA